LDLSIKFSGKRSSRQTPLVAEARLLFGAGLSLWIVYGFYRKDVVIILANGLSLVILSALLYLKLIQK
jgi:lipid-A-disaccharide synthase-like uncharacterized protein